MQVDGTYLGGWVADVRGYMGKLGITVNGAVVEDLERRYVSLITKGYPRATFTGEAMDAATIPLFTRLIQDSQQNGPTVRAFLRGLYALTRTGKVPIAKWDPKGVTEARAAATSFHTGGFLDKLSTVWKAGTGMFKLALVAGIVGVGGYALYKFGPKGK